MSILDVARLEADAAAAAAGVAIVEVAAPGELDVLRSTMESVWGPEVVPPRNLLRGMALSGACLLVARRHGEPIGFALGWLGWDGGVHFHSHQVGVRADIRSGGIGFALKLTQRVLCLHHDVTAMRWTYDPMLMSNARFNLQRLGAQVVGFVPHCYGDRVDAFNTGDRTDRLEVEWRLDAAVGGHPVDPTGRASIAVPSDYPGMRRTDPAAAAAARERVGASFAEATARGVRVLGVGDAGYVLDAPDGMGLA